MCIVCKDWIIGKLTIKEAWRNLNEIRDGGLNEKELDHYFEVAEKLSEASDETIRN